MAGSTESETKQKILRSAVMLFNTKGYNGTSVRDIAKKADVNVSLISYYFGGKQGLAEHLMTSFLEGYVGIIETAYMKLDYRTARECFFEAVKGILDYQQENRQLARFVHREITFDTVLVREIMTTYLMKEKFYLARIIENGFARQEFIPQSIDYLIMQLRGMLTMPFLHPQYILEVHHIQPNEEYFKEKYYRQLKQWIELSLCQTSPSWSKKPVAINV
ncbi:forespore capture DNA-binding protein RefZ [Pseudalkalibacillus caeni]|uniref:TetR/AcrR family transcriptional regulator n=1 Tax=Exobacillus caeni TaxID=2574798 RepID=A0A5R9FET5_9BACL|nr:forespore capture DNA-binding protein RefZ [Pseudalkalibacillus caeni]TLS39094.1 TetR/AcrR family transcriptional regulator [Pseudalkalibacillus caeni]